MLEILDDQPEAIKQSQFSNGVLYKLREHKSEGN